jgi:hypothetical protein
MHASLNRIRPSSLNSQFSLPYASCRGDVIARPTIDKHEDGKNRLEHLYHYHPAFAIQPPRFAGHGCFTRLGAVVRPQNATSIR